MEDSVKDQISRNFFGHAPHLSSVQFFSRDPQFFTCREPPKVGSIYSFSVKVRRSPCFGVFRKAFGKRNEQYDIVLDDHHKTDSKMFENPKGYLCLKILFVYYLTYRIYIMLPTQTLLQAVKCNNNINQSHTKPYLLNQWKKEESKN